MNVIVNPLRVLIDLAFNKGDFLISYIQLMYSCCKTMLTQRDRILYGCDPTIKLAYHSFAKSGF